MVLHMCTSLAYICSILLSMHTTWWIFTVFSNMASGSSSTLALKAAVVATILTVLVLPSSARCQGRKPGLAASPAPAPAGPAPAMECSDCDSY
jgi:hypothetical protein